jgi:tetratricopeptide (TPR) repeat protein
MIANNRPLCLSLLAICTLIFACSREVSKPSPAFPVISDSVSTERACLVVSRYLASGAPDADTNSLGFFYRTLDSSANELVRSCGGRGAEPATADSIIALVYKRWNIAFDARDTVFETLLPHLVCKNRKGACLGVSLIVLMLAEKLNCPLYGVMLPGHFFMRFDNGTLRFNIEPNKSGFTHPDSYYRERYPVAHRAWYDLGNLTKSQSIGMLCYNAGVLCLRHNNCNQAISLFDEATRRIPALAEARGNLALAYVQAGLTDSSLSIFERLFATHPDMPGLAANYGAVALAAQRYCQSADVFRAGLRDYPGDSTLVRGLSQASANAGSCAPRKTR